MEAPVRPASPAVSRATAAIDSLLQAADRWRGQHSTDTQSSAARRALASRDAVDSALHCILFHRMCEERSVAPFGRLRTTLPELLPGVEDDDSIVHDIIDDLYAPGLASNFSLLPPDFLGRVYEQVLSSDSRRSARKHGGVYYTPARVVDYVVDRTVGTLLNEHKRDAAIRVVDPACGGGSFVLGAYQHLLQWYQQRDASDEPEWQALHRGAPIGHGERPSSEFRVPSSARRLSPAVRLGVLREHLFGVDIDPIAVEITKMSLVLMAFDGFSKLDDCDEFDSLAQQALRDLESNIKCGNALIRPRHGPETVASAGAGDNGFDWHAEFPNVFAGAKPGFDAVIGNPPWVSYSGRQAVTLPPGDRERLEREYDTGGWLTAHGLFIQRSVRDLSRRYTSFIVPDQVGHLAGYAAVRRAVAANAGVVEVRYWGEDVFDGVVSPTLTFVADREHCGETEIIDARGERSRAALAHEQCWHIAARDGAPIEIRVPTHSLGKLVGDPGVHTGNCAERLILDASQSRPGCVPILEGKQVTAYACGRPTKALNLSVRAGDGEYFTIRPIERYTRAPFLIRQTAGYPIVGPRRHADYYRNSLLALYPPADGTNVRYLVGVLNSMLSRHLYVQMVHESRQKAFPQVKVRSLRALPIRTIDMSDVRDREMHDRVIEHVIEILAIQESRDADDQQRAELTTRIDELVFELYGLTNAEIDAMEAGVQGAQAGH